MKHMEPPESELWVEFLHHNLCGLCGNTGVVDTIGLRTPAGVHCGVVRACICPNGRMWAQHDYDEVTLTLLRRDLLRSK